MGFRRITPVGTGFATDYNRLAMIHLAAVSKKYKNLLAIRDLSVSIRPGAVGLLGPNGAGKSTLIKSLLGLVRLTSGQATVFDEDVAKNSRRIRELVGYMPEDDCYFSGLQGIEAVAYSGELAGMPCRVALRRAHEILDFVSIGEERYREVQTFSTGMKQKIKFAQALVHSPRLVFLDEPTSGLDPEGRERMLLSIRALAREKGVSVVLSTHILKDVEACCDAVLMLSKGQLLAYDTLENLRRPVDESFLVHFGGDTARFTRALQSAGLQATPEGLEELRVGGSAHEVGPALFRAAAESETSIRQVSSSRNSLEEIFLRALSGNRNADL